MAFHSTRRLWGRLGLPAILTVSSIGAALVLRYTQGGLLTEGYALLSAPFRPQIDVEVALSSAVHRQLQAQLTELQTQNQQLRALLDMQQDLSREGVAAAVVGRSADRWWKQLTLGKGSAHGIKPGDIVMAPGGLLGRVEAVTAHTSRVLLVSDPSSRVGVTLSRTRAMGILRGLGSRLAVLEFFERTTDIQVGDAIVSSGLGSHYPGGLVVGHVQSVDFSKSPAPAATIELSVPITQLEWGLVYSYNALNHDSE